MRKKLVKILSGIMLFSCVGISQAKADWKQIDNEKWIYFNTDGTQLKDGWVNNKPYTYYLDSNGYWINKTKENYQQYYSISFDKNTGEIDIICSNLTRCPVGDDEKQLSFLIVKKSDVNNIKSTEVLKKYKVICDSNGVYKLALKEE